MQEISLTVNGTAHKLSVADNELLVDVLRQNLNLTGTHTGCDTSQCGACVVHVEGRSVKSCTLLAAELDGKKVTTIEGIGANGLSRLQQAFRDNHGLQCGFCTPGMIMSATELLARNPKPDEATIRHWLEGNICRCTGYHNIVKSVQAAAS